MGATPTIVPTSSPWVTVLYEMLTGHRGFAKESSAETLAAILREDPRPMSQLVPDVPPSLQRVVQRCLEKNPEQRFQSASDLAFALESLSDSAITSGSGTLKPENERRRWPFVIAATAVLVCAAIAITYFATRPPAVPTLSNYVRLTTDGEPKTIFGTDGSRLYLSLGLPLSSRGAAQMSVAGGDIQNLSIIPEDMVPLCLSPDGLQVLAAKLQVFGAGSPLFSVPIMGGSPRRLGDMLVQNTTLSHDSTRVAYTLGGDLFVANADGSNPRKIVSATSPNDYVSAVAWSPQDDRLRFGHSDFSAASTSMWEVRSDGSGLHSLLAHWKRLPSENGDLTWTGDGKFFLYVSLGQIWMLPQQGTLFHREIKPVQLTNSPLVLSSPTPSKDGKKLFVVGYGQRGELVRYDSKSHQFAPFLGGISGEFASFSPDGQWVAYVHYPEGTVWRSKIDGTERLQLTSSPNSGLVPRWSPDGKQILVALYSYQNPEHLFLIARDGGTPVPLFPNDASAMQDGTWSPDGKRIIFSAAPGGAQAELRMVELDTHRVETLPGSQGLFSPRWSPDGRYVAALMLGPTNLMLFDFQKQAWKEISNTSNLGWLNWSKDGGYIYYLFYGAPDSIRRVRISDDSIEVVQDIKEFSPTGIWGDSLTLAPDDSPLLLRNTGTHDVYSLDVKEP